MTLPNPHEPLEVDLPPRKVSGTSLLCAASVASVTVPLALVRAGPDWIEIPMVLIAVVSAFVCAGELWQLLGRGRRRQQGPSSHDVVPGSA